MSKWGENAGSNPLSFDFTTLFPRGSVCWCFSSTQILWVLYQAHCPPDSMSGPAEKPVISRKPSVRLLHRGNFSPRTLTHSQGKGCRFQAAAEWEVCLLIIVIKPCSARERGFLSPAPCPPPLAGCSLKCKEYFGQPVTGTEASEDSAPNEVAPSWGYWGLSEKCLPMFKMILWLSKALSGMGLLL